MNLNVKLSLLKEVVFEVCFIPHVDTAACGLPDLPVHPCLLAPQPWWWFKSRKPVTTLCTEVIRVLICLQNAVVLRFNLGLLWIAGNNRWSRWPGFYSNWGNFCYLRPPSHNAQVWGVCCCWGFVCFALKDLKLGRLELPVLHKCCRNTF